MGSAWPAWRLSGKLLCLKIVHRHCRENVLKLIIRAGFDSLGERIQAMGARVCPLGKHSAANVLWERSCRLHSSEWPLLQWLPTLMLQAPEDTKTLIDNMTQSMLMALLGPINGPMAHGSGQSFMGYIDNDIDIDSDSAMAPTAHGPMAFDSAALIRRPNSQTHDSDSWTHESGSCT